MHFAQAVRLWKLIRCKSTLFIPGAAWNRMPGLMNCFLSACQGTLVTKSATPNLSSAHCGPAPKPLVALLPCQRLNEHIKLNGMYSKL